MTRQSLPFTLRLLPLLILAASGVATSAQAQSLVDLYTAARGYDATYQSAKSQFDATMAKSEQAKALMLPTVGLSAGASQTNQDVQQPASKNYSYTSQNVTLSAS